MWKSGVADEIVYPVMSHRWFHVAEQTQQGILFAVVRVDLPLLSLRSDANPPKPLL